MQTNVLMLAVYGDSGPKTRFFPGGYSFSIPESGQDGGSGLGPLLGDIQMVEHKPGVAGQGRRTWIYWPHRWPSPGGWGGQIPALLGGRAHSASNVLHLCFTRKDAVRGTGASPSTACQEHCTSHAPQDPQSLCVIFLFFDFLVEPFLGSSSMLFVIFLDFFSCSS